MTQNVTAEIIRTIKTELTSHSKGNVTSVFVLALLENYQEHPKTVQIEFLDIMTRKIDIAQRICKEYDTEWKLAVNKEPVSKNVILGLALSLALTKLPQNTNNLGRSFKWLNSGFNALRLLPKSNKIFDYRVAQVLQTLEKRFNVVIGE